MGHILSLKEVEKTSICHPIKSPSPTFGYSSLSGHPREGKGDREIKQCQVKYLNNVIKADHGKFKRLIKPVRGFKTMKTAYATIKGFEVMRALKKRQASHFNFSGDIKGEIRMIERAFGLGNCAMADIMTELEIRLKAA